MRSLVLLLVLSCNGPKPPPLPPRPFACANVTVAPVNAGMNTPGAACKMDADCTRRPQGRCVMVSQARHDPPTFACVYDECASDADCPKGTVCICGSGIGTSRNACVPGNCHVETVRESIECGGFSCAASLSSVDVRGGPRKVEGYYCHTRYDQCRTDRDCSLEGASACAYAKELGRFICMGIAPME